MLLLLVLVCAVVVGWRCNPEGGLETSPSAAPWRMPAPRSPRSDMIDDGYWQGAPVGGFGAGTFSRTYRGDFSRWHVKTGVHKYETV